MPWTYEQRIHRVSQSLIEQDLLLEQDVFKLKRPMFFGRYSFSIGFQPERHLWYQFEEIEHDLAAGLEGLDYQLLANSKTLDYYLFSSDPNVLRWFLKKKNSKPFMLNHLRLVDPSCWHLKLPKPRPKGKFYDEYGWRISFKEKDWLSSVDAPKHLARLQGPVKIATKPRSFLYLSQLSDVLMFKLMAAEQILDIEDRSSL